MTDNTHAATAQSWVASADGHADFPIQNLPFGVFSPDGAAPRGGVAIGDAILDIPAALEAGLLDGPEAEAAAKPTLNGFLSLGSSGRIELRAKLFALLADSAAASVPPLTVAREVMKTKRRSSANDLRNAWLSPCA